MEIKEYLESLSAETFQFVASKMIADQHGITIHPDGDGSCNSQNCFGTTGCHQATNNGYCACQGPNGPCVWVPGV